MTILDIMVPPRAWRFVSVRTTSLGAEQACDDLGDPFTGAELLRGVFGVEGGTVAACLADAAPLPVADAMLRRGAVLVNSAGRVGVVVGVNRVVQAAGRRWAVTITDPSWWAHGWWLPGVLCTTIMGGGVRVNRLIPDPEHPGMFFAMPLVPDPDNPGLYLPYPLVEDSSGTGVYLTEW